MGRSGSRWRPGTIVVAALLLVAAVFVLTGLLPADDASALGRRVAPALGFVVAVTIVAELARDAAVFDIVARLLSRWGRGRVFILWALVVLLATLSTVFLSLDTTAVIVTPVVVLLALGLGLPPLPFALVTIWLANTASLLLPVSNLTNLLAATRIGIGPVAFLALTWAPALAGVVIPVAILTLRYRRVLLRVYELPPRVEASDPWLFRIAAAVVALLLPLLAVSTEVWIPSTVAAVALIVLFAIRRRNVLRLSLVPWRAIGLAAGLFVIVETAHARGLGDLLTPLAVHGHGLGEILTVAAPEPSARTGSTTSRPTSCSSPPRRETRSS